MPFINRGNQLSKAHLCTRGLANDMAAALNGDVDVPPDFQDAFLYFDFDKEQYIYDGKRVELTDVATIDGNGTITLNESPVLGIDAFTFAFGITWSPAPTAATGGFPLYIQRTSDTTDRVYAGNDFLNDFTVAVREDGADQAKKVVDFSIDVDVRYNVAGRVAADDFQFYSNGGPVGSDTDGEVPDELQRFEIRRNIMLGTQHFFALFLDGKENGVLQALTQ